MNFNLFLSRKLINIAQLIEEPRIIKSIHKGLILSCVRDLFNIKKMIKINPKTFIDVGGHYGQTSLAMNFIFPKAKIYSFEPVKNSYEILKEKTKDIENIKIFNFGLGNENKKSSFWLNDFDGASSLLNSTEERDKTYEVTRNKNKIDVDIRRFDSLKDIEIRRPLYVKIDVEGAEKLVLEGFGDLVKEIDVLQIEFNFKNLYENQTKLKDVLKYTELAGLDNFIQLGNHITEEGIIYCDLIFFKCKESSPSAKVSQ